MSKSKYEAEINNYYFIMNDDDTIEVWSDYDGEHPESYIYVRPGSIKNEKDFHFEVSDWFIKNCGQ
jgi:translation elongation factor EF-Ts